METMLTNKLKAAAALVLLLAAVTGAVTGRQGPASGRESAAPGAGNREAPVLQDRPGRPADSEVRFLSLAEARALARKRHLAGPLVLSEVEAERVLSEALLNVELAYWNLYGTYGNLHTRDEGLRLAYRTWQAVRAGHQAGRVSLADLAQARGQYELFRAQRLQAREQVADAEQQLRSSLGMTGDGGPRLVPADAPILTPNSPDWAGSLKEALEHHPEMVLARQQVKADQANVLRVKNSLLPDLRFAAAGDVPVTLRQAERELARSYQALKDQEQKAERFLGLQYRQMITRYEQIKANQAQRLAFQTQLKVRSEQYSAGRGTLDLLLEAQRFWADALSQEYAAAVAYTNARRSFAFARGALLREGDQEPGGVATLSPPTLPVLWKGMPPLKDARPLPPDADHPGKGTTLIPYKLEDLFPSAAP
jgi:hypothetical protein